MIPLFKKGKSEDMDNYSPISILPTVSKLLKRAVHVQLCDNLREHNILSPYQCGEPFPAIKEALFPGYCRSRIRVVY